MNETAAAAERLTAMFLDGLGERMLHTDPATGESLDTLHFRPELSALPTFEFALRERVARLANFQHGYYARVRRVERAPGGALALVSEHVPGVRLVDVLRAAERHRVPLDVGAALCVVRQVLAAVSLLHENARDVAHGALAIERIVLTPYARPVIVEHVLGAALEQLQLSRDRYWRELQIAAPPAAGSVRLDQRGDVTAIGVIALSLLLGRPLRADEYPSGLMLLVTQATESSAAGERRPLTPALQTWLVRALQVDPRRSFDSIRTAQFALEDQVLSDTGGYVASPIALESFLSRSLQPGGAREAPAPVTRPRSVRATFAPGGGEGQGEGEFAFGPVERPMFGVDTPPIAAPVTEVPLPARSRWLRVAALVLVMLAVGQALALRAGRTDASLVAPSTAQLVVESRPAGIAVFIDGEPKGATPLRAAIKPGPHILELRGAGTPRVVPFTAAAGSEISKLLELPDAVSSAPGTLHVATDPPGAEIAIDNQPRGVSPLTVPDLPAGLHTVTVTTAHGAVSQTIEIAAGASASLVVPLGPAGAPVSGWLAIDAPVAVQVFEDGRLIGTSEAERLMVSAGRHQIDLVNETLGFSAARTVQVPAGKVVRVGLEWPLGVMHVNALPWAEVWIDGRRAGETPLGNVELPIGPHEVVFRHPELGERRHAVTVTLRGPARVSADLRK